jgi:hypothetical protein
MQVKDIIIGIHREQSALCIFPVPILLTTARATINQVTQPVIYLQICIGIHDPKGNF